MANQAFNKFVTGILTGAYNVGSGGDTIKASLHTSSFTPNIDSMDFFDDLTNEVSSSGSYTAGIAGGLTLANKTVAQDNTDNEGVFDADDMTITGFTGSFRYVVLRKDTGVAGTSPLICYYDNGSDITATAGTVTIAINSEGLINTTVV